MKKIFSRLVIAVVVASSILCVFATDKNVYAAADMTAMANKAEIFQLYVCLSSHLTPEFKAVDYGGLGTAINVGDNKERRIGLYSDTYPCMDLIKKYGEKKYGVTSWASLSTDAKLREFLTKGLGYEVDNTGVMGGTLTINTQKSVTRCTVDDSTEAMYNPTYDITCSGFTPTEEIVTSEAISHVGTDVHVLTTASSSTKLIDISHKYDSGDYGTITVTLNALPGTGFLWMNKPTISYTLDNYVSNGTLNLQKLGEDIRNDIAAEGATSITTTEIVNRNANEWDTARLIYTVTYTLLPTTAEAVNSDPNQLGVYKRNGKTAADIVQTLTGKQPSRVKFTNEERVALQEYYLTTVYNTDFQHCGEKLGTDIQANLIGEEYVHATAVFRNGQKTDCWVKPGNSDGGTYDKSTKLYSGGKSVSFVNGDNDFQPIAMTWARLIGAVENVDMNEVCKEARLPDWQKSYNNANAIINNSDGSHTDEEISEARTTLNKLLAIYDPSKPNEGKWASSDGTCVEIPGIENTPVGLEESSLNTADPQTQEPTSLDICMNSAEGLGWILCLIVDALEGVVSAFYDGVIEPMLAIDSDFFADGNETYEAWNIFRNIANIFFVILLLIVILSQVTGYGIDNYGIKKILPKLIITAILVNLSYFICSLAVDVSNILGSGLRTMLGGIAGGPTINESGEGGFMNGIVTSLLVLGIGGTAVVAAIASPGIIISIVVALLGALISIFFMLVALGARMVGVIILLVISPLALVLYALPNTSKVFDKWFNAFKAVLLVYPICGALVGGGQFASRLILGLVNGNDIAAFFYTLLAMLVGVLPFFAIPTLLKSSMAALGNIGAKISSVGAGLSRGTQNTIRGSELYKRGVTSANNLDIGGMKTKLANTKFGRATGYSGIRARQIAAANKMKSDDRAAGVELEDEILNRMERADPTRVPDKALKERVRRAAADGDQDKTFAAFEAYASRVGASKASNDAIEIFDDLQAANGGAGAGVMAGEHRGEFLRDMAKNQAFSKAPDWQRYAAASGRDADGNNVRFAGQRGDGSYMGSVFKPGDLKSDQVVGAGAASMSRILSSGAVSQAEAQSIMASQDNWDKMDATQKLIMQAYAEHNDVLSKEQAEELLKPPEPGTTGYTLRLSAPQDYNYKYANALIAPRPQNVNIAGQTATLKIEHGGGTP